MRFTESLGLELVTTDDAVAVARVDGFVVDPSAHRITALRLTDVDGDGSFVSFDDLRGFGRDAVTVEGRSVIRDSRDEREERAPSGELDLVGKRVLTESGDEVGTVDDVEFDPGDGTITEVLTSSDAIAGSRLLGVGSYAVVVAAAG